MVLTAIFIIVFSLSVARGISKRISLAQSAKQVKPQIEMVIPVKKQIERVDETAHFSTFVKERRKVNLKAKTQKINIGCMNDNHDRLLFLN